jgi:hypothetical protein
MSAALVQALALVAVVVAAVLKPYPHTSPNSCSYTAMNNPTCSQRRLLKRFFTMLKTSLFFTDTRLHRGLI